MSDTNAPIFVEFEDAAEDEGPTFYDLDPVQQEEVVWLQAVYDEVLSIEDDAERLAAAEKLVAEMGGQ